QSHDRGSSHGQVRMIRQAYFEHPDYVPLLKTAYEKWDELCALSGRALFHRTGLLIAGDEDSKILQGIRRSSAQFEIPVVEFYKDALKAQFPPLNLPENFHGILEPGAGYLEVENGVSAFCDLAQKSGAALRFNERVLHCTAM